MASEKVAEGQGGITLPFILKPQEGPQEDFLSTPADICIYGG